jgi:hypothetical protein
VGRNPSPPYRPYYLRLRITCLTMSSGQICPMKMAVLVFSLTNAWWRVGTPDSVAGTEEAMSAPATGYSQSV